MKISNYKLPLVFATISLLQVGVIQPAFASELKSTKFDGRESEIIYYTDSLDSTQPQVLGANTEDGEYALLTSYNQVEFKLQDLVEVLKTTSTFKDTMLSKANSKKSLTELVDQLNSKYSASNNFSLKTVLLDMSSLLNKIESSQVSEKKIDSQDITKVNGLVTKLELQVIDLLEADENLNSNLSF